jgi:membrane protein YdbS with pleckstrin-like domain
MSALPPGSAPRGPTPVYQGILGTLARWLRVPLIPPSVPPGQPRWVRSFGPAESFLRYLKLQYLLVVGLLALVLVPLSILILFGLLQDGKPLGAIALLLLVILPAAVWALVGYAALRFQFDTTWYVMTDRAIRLRSGIWVLKELTVTFDNVQNVKIRQGPVQRWLGIGDVTIETAAVGAVNPQNGATSASTAVVAGVADSQEIRDRIVERMRASRSAGLGDADDGPPRREREGAGRRGGGTGLTRAAVPPGSGGGWSPAHLRLLRELRDEVSRMR